METTMTAAELRNDRADAVAQLMRWHKWDRRTAEWADAYYQGKASYNVLIAVLGLRKAKRVAAVR